MSSIELDEVSPAALPSSILGTVVGQPDDSTIESEDDHQIPSADGGAAAWRLLGTAFVFETLLWGFPLSFGVFQDYYSRSAEFAGNPYIGVVGTVASGLGYIGAPFIMPFIQGHPQWRRHMIWIGWSICISGLVAGSLATSLEVLILTQGVAYGFGFLILYYPILLMVNEYWVARRGMAYGILCGASGLSGTFMPFAIQALLARYGYQTTLRAVAVGLAVVTGPLIPFLKGRLPPSEHTAPPKISWIFLKNPLLWIYSLSNFFQGCGYFFPALYLPSFARSLSLGDRSGAILLAAMSVSQVGGQFTFGILSDKRVSLDVLACTSTAVAAIATFTMWYLAGSLPILAVFAILYGFFGAGFTAIWARTSSTITNDVTSGPIVFGLLNFGKGIGNVLAGPIGGILVHGSAAKSSPSQAVTEHSYRWVIVFTGACMLASACTISAKHLNLAMRSTA